MQHLLTLNPENASEEEIKSYSARSAARAVILDDVGLVALLHVDANDYYKLPGGGMEEAENKLEALERECLEEAGCRIAIRDEIGTIIEHRKMFRLNQTSYCYLVNVKGEKGVPNFTQEEIQNGFNLEWFTYEEALNALRGCHPKDAEGKQYIVPRDIAFLEAAEVFL
jgi:8-oxo-dGTP pyrophosphatase MutT (NUDIX family)